MIRRRTPSHVTVKRGALLSHHLRMSDNGATRSTDTRGEDHLEDTILHYVVQCYIQLFHSTLQYSTILHCNL